jgi:hypothetical protein
VFSLTGALSHARLQPGLLRRSAGFCPGGLRRLKGMCRMRQQLITPLVVRGVAHLVFVTAFRSRLTLYPFENHAGVGLGLPLPSVHG